MKTYLSKGYFSSPQTSSSSPSSSSPPSSWSSKCTFTLLSFFPLRWSNSYWLNLEDLVRHMNLSDTIRHQDSDILSDTSCLVSYILTRQRQSFCISKLVPLLLKLDTKPELLIQSIFPSYLAASALQPVWDPWRQIYGGFACSSLLQICSSPTRKQAELTLDSALFVGFSIIKEIRRGVIW